MCSALVFLDVLLHYALQIYCSKYIDGKNWSLGVTSKNRFYCHPNLIAALYFEKREITIVWSYYYFAYLFTRWHTPWCKQPYLSSACKCLEIFAPRMINIMELFRKETLFPNFSLYSSWISNRLSRFILMFYTKECVLRSMLKRVVVHFS